MQHAVTDRRTALYWLALMPAAAGNVLTAAFDAAPTGAAQCRPTGADLRVLIGPAALADALRQPGRAPPAM